jgi:hypothetical protein
MEPKEFAVRSRELVQRRPTSEVSDDLVLGRRVNPVTLPLGLTLVVGSPLVRSASIVRDIPGDADDPGKLKFRRNLIEAPPDDHERLVDQIVQVEAPLNPASQIVGHCRGIGGEEATESVLRVPWHIY